MVQTTGTLEKVAHAGNGHKLLMIESPAFHFGANELIWQQGEYSISTDRSRLDVALIHHFLSEESYWARGRSSATVLRSINHSVCFGLYHTSGKQVGFTRAITDFATHCYLADLFVLAPHRGRGLGKWLVQCALAHPDLQDLPRWMLKTADAHGLYRRFGFIELSAPDMMMELTVATGR